MVQGVVTAIGTPLGPREELHEAGMRRQVRLQLEAGVDALLVLGSMGAMQMLPDDTCRAALRVAVDEAAGRVPVLAGCGDTGTERTRTRIRWAEETAADAVVLASGGFEGRWSVRTNGAASTPATGVYVTIASSTTTATAATINTGRSTVTRPKTRWAVTRREAAPYGRANVSEKIRRR